MMTKITKDLYYSAWATAWGPIGAVMGAQGLRRIVLPHYQLKDLLDLLAWEHSGAVKDDKPFDGLIERTRDYFNGKSVDFSEVVCDLPGEGTLGGLVLRACRKIPHGQTRSYHVLAETISRPDAARAVAGALGKNSIPLVTEPHQYLEQFLHICDVETGGRLIEDV